MTDTKVYQGFQDNKKVKEHWYIVNIYQVLFTKRIKFVSLHMIQEFSEKHHHLLLISQNFRSIWIVIFFC